MRGARGGDYDAAFGILEAASREAKKPERARLALYLGHLHALYGDAALAELGAALREARTLDPARRDDPLYLALSAELDARTRGEEAAPPPRRRARPLTPCPAFTRCARWPWPANRRRPWTCMWAAPTCPSTCAGACAPGRPTPTRAWARAPRRRGCMPKPPTSLRA
ncbi:hypothetical protein [Deinococcus multiflagellatus]|uniref:Tetratricopeptide repeat protein n=1 Tax=Deinococcus multiflagellatus TaxID=1656887 RepID=A0ABW1ZK71_9DEIO